MAGLENVDVSHGLRFNSADHALEAACEGAGVLLAHDLLAYDDLRTRRLVIPIALALPAERAWHLVWPRAGRDRPQVQAFRRWMKDELAAVDWSSIRGKAPRRVASRRERARKRAQKTNARGRRA
jgi:LysR family glycine cleavage system transcriptional activator